MKNKGLVYGIIVSLIIFAIFSIVSNVGREIWLDTLLITWAEAISSPHIVKMMEAVSMIGSLEILLGMTVAISIILIIKKDTFHAFFCIFIMTSGLVVNLLLKLVFQRARPGDQISYIEAFGHSFDIVSYSYPSGHTMRMALFVLFLMYVGSVYVKKKASRVIHYMITTLLLCLVAISRVVLGAHYPSDVLASISVSIAYFCICLYFLPIYKRHSRLKSVL